MGARLIIESSKGITMHDAYRTAVDEAIYEHGNDPYNGSISTTNGVVDKTKDFLASKMTIQDYADYLYTENKISKWGSAVGITIKEPETNTNKVKTQVDINRNKVHREWKTMYQITNEEDRIIGEYEFQKDAIAKAREYTEKNQETTYIDITKKLMNAPSRVGRISYKHSSKNYLGTYYFIAIAAE